MINQIESGSEANTKVIPHYLTNESRSLGNSIVWKMRRGALNTALAAFVLASFTIEARAGVLVKYPFDNNSDGATPAGFAYSTFDSGVLASSTVAKGAGLGTFAVGTDSWSGSVQVLKTGPGVSITGATAAEAIANNWYFEITLDPTASMDVRSIEADWSRGGTTSVRGWFVRSSLDNYVSDLYANETPVGTATGLQHVGFDITGFTGLSTAVSYRFYVYTETTGRFMDFQNVQFNSHALTSNSNVPEPSTAIAMGLLGIIGFAGNRRRRRQVSVA